MKRTVSKRALIYARVSYDDRKNEARNLEGQVEDGQAYCQERDYRIVAELAEDDRGVSGADWDLPMLNQALDMARAGEFDVLVTRELDRFARGLAKQLVVESEFKRHGVEVEYILGEYPDTPEGQLNKNIRAVIAEFEREKIAQRMTRGRRQVCKAGKVMLHGNKPPYGYRVEDRMLVIYEPEAKVVRLIFTWYVYGDENGKILSINAVANRLTGMRVPTWGDIHKNPFGKKKRRRGEWNRNSVRKILTNETYAGVWHYSKRRNAGKDANPREQWLAVAVPAIVSREVWEKAQERRAYNKEMAERNTKHNYLMGRRVVCGQCGSKMAGKSVSKKYLYYYCPKNGCNSRLFRVDQVDTAVWEWVKKILLHPEALWEELKEQQAERERENQPLRDRLGVIDDLLADNRRELEKLLDVYLSSDISKETFVDRKTRYETTMTALEKEQTDLEMTLESQTLTDARIMTLREKAGKVANDLEKIEGNFEAKRQLIDEMDARARLIIEDGLKKARVRCLIGDEETLSIGPTTLESDV
ncbi:MAG: recombinase family protein [Promethearchaeota archaeon]